MKTIKTIKTIYTVIAVCSISAATALAAAQKEPYLSLHFEDQSKPGQLVVSTVTDRATAAGIVPGDVLVEVCTVPANAAHAAKIEALARSAPVKQGQDQSGKEVCGPIKTIADKMTIVAPFAMRGKVPGYALENTMTFKRQNGQEFTTKLANSY